MSQFLLKFIFALFVCPVALGLQIGDLVGTWDVTAEGELNEGVEMQARERVTYDRDGTFLCQGGVFISLKENGVRLMTVGGEDRGHFEIKEGKLHLRTTNMEVDFFVSLMPDVTRSTFDEGMEDMLSDEDVYTVVSLTKDKIVIEDEETGMQSVMTRFVKPSEVKQMTDDPTRRIGVKTDALGERYRWFSMSLLEIEGFSASKGLPKWKERSGVGSELRKKEEILNRLMCCYAAVTWVCFPEDTVPSLQLQALIEQLALKEHFTEQEKEILGTDRKDAAEKFQSLVGWQIESMLALAWVVGFEEVPGIVQDQVGEEMIGKLFQFLAPAWADKDAFLNRLEMRPLNEVAQIEDIFYCAHNAVRSAQTGKENCVPEGFHAIRHGGIIHEKRHALTWVLSPGVDWDDTDLST